MNRKLWINIFSILLLLVAAPAAAQSSSDETRKSEEQAIAVLKRVSAFLGQAKAFSVTIDAGFDAVQGSGQKIEFGETRKVVLRRPNHLRIDSTKRDGTKDGLVFNGKEITVFHLRDNVYATAAKVGTVDQAVDFLVQELDVRVPLAELLKSDVSKTLPEKIRSAAYVEQSSIGGVPCDHIALRGDEVDAQLWVSRDKQSLPRRLVITYKRTDGRPQFWAQFSDWNMSPQAPDSLFVHKPAKDAARIAFAPRPTQQPGAPAMKGAQ